MENFARKKVYWNRLSKYLFHQISLMSIVKSYPKFITMRKKCLIILISHIYILGISQSIVFKDKIDGKTIPYVQVKVNNRTLYSDSTGKFDLKNPLETNEIFLSRIGYKDKQAMIKKNTEILYLEPIYQEIEPIAIGYKEKILITNDYKKSVSSRFQVGIETGIVIENQYSKKGIIKNIQFGIKDLRNNKNGYLILNFYELKDGFPTNKIINTAPIFIPLSEIVRNNNRIDISENPVNFPSDGVFMSIKIITEIGKYDLKASEPFLSFYTGNQNKKVFYKTENGNWKSFPTPLPFIGYKISVSI